MRGRRGFGGVGGSSVCGAEDDAGDGRGAEVGRDADDGTDAGDGTVAGDGTDADGGRISGFKTVADPPQRHDEFRVNAETFAQQLDVRVERPVVAVEIIAPDVV